MFSINQLGSPASSKLLGFFINKGASHIRVGVNLSFLKGVLFTLERLSRLQQYWKRFSHSPLISLWLAALTKHPKRQPLFLSPALFQGERWAFNESPPAPAVFWAVSSLRQAAWVMEVTEKTPALNHRWQRGGERGREVEGGRRTAWWEKHTTRQQTCRDYHL